MSSRPPAPPVAQRNNLTTELVRLLAREIGAGKLRPGAQLPTEQDMMAAYGVSRTVIREAISALRSSGIVVTKQGLGTFVSRETQRQPFRIDPRDLGTLQEVLRIMELRKSVEIEAAAMAAERRSARDLSAIRGALQRIADAIERREAGIDEDFELHRAIAAATGNHYFVAFLQFLGHHIIPRQTLRIEHEGAEDRALYLRRVQAEHRAICDAIARKDPPAARSAMRAHLENSMKRYRIFGEAVGAAAPAKRARPSGGRGNGRATARAKAGRPKRGRRPAARDGRA
ncbi:MAG: FadR family transcriptional regulator [Alphaproteobacteria bacterium]|nr:FadR family transcriptional regulator [Alphaproteobacteria bacterium]